jgi:hypothetical protein
VSGPSVITQGYQPSGSLNLVVTMGYGQFAHISPPIPPTPPDQGPLRYGPALTPAERRRWFGDFESPLSRAARRKTKEYLQRVEFGILPPEVKEEVLAKVVEKVTLKAETYIKERPKFNQDRVVNSVVKEMKSEIRQLLENRRIMLEEQSEEEDIVVISSILLQ